MRALDWLYTLSRWGLGIVFIYAGGVKLLEPEVFAVLIESYGIVPDPLLMPVAVALPLLEVIAGAGLLIDMEGSLATITLLLLIFMAILGYGIHMGLDVDCGCFGPEDPEAKAFHGLRESLYRDLVMLGVVFWMYGWRRYRAIQPVRITAFIERLKGKRRTKDAVVSMDA